MNLSNLFAKAGQLIKSNSPEILTALGVSGVVTTAYLTGKASYSVARDEDADLYASNKEKIKRYWKLYIPAAISGTLTTTCIVFSSRTSSRRAAAAVTAYSITERAFSEYREKVVEQIGKNKEQKIRDEIAEERVSKNPPVKEVIIAGSGHVLCCELYTHRYFRSDMEMLRKTQNDINQQIISHLYVTLDDFYDLVGLETTSESDRLGWDSDRLMELEFTTVLSSSGEPCLAFNYNYVKPIR